MVTMERMADAFEEETGEHPLLNTRPTLELDPEAMRRLVEWAEEAGHFTEERTGPLPTEQE